MSIKAVRTLILSIFLLGLGGCQALMEQLVGKQPEQTSLIAILKTELSYLDLDNPKNDLNKNIAHKDYRFMCVYGVSIVCPGMVNPDYMQTYGTRMIEGTSDTLEGDEHNKLQGIAFVYAEKYNMYLTEKIKSIQKEGKDPNKTVVF